MAEYVGKWKKINDENRKTPNNKAENFAFTIAMAITNHINELKISRNDLAKQLNVSKSYITQILQGHTNMTILTICKLAHALGMEPFISIDSLDAASQRQQTPYPEIPAASSTVATYIFNKPNITPFQAWVDDADIMREPGDDQIAVANS